MLSSPQTSPESTLFVFTTAEHTLLLLADLTVGAAAVVGAVGNEEHAVAAPADLAGGAVGVGEALVPLLRANANQCRTPPRDSRDHHRRSTRLAFPMSCRRHHNQPGGSR